MQTWMMRSLKDVFFLYPNVFLNTQITFGSFHDRGWFAGMIVAVYARNAEFGGATMEVVVCF